MEPILDAQNTSETPTPEWNNKFFFSNKGQQEFQTVKEQYEYEHKRMLSSPHSLHMFAAIWRAIAQLARAMSDGIGDFWVLASYIDFGGRDISRICKWNILDKFRKTIGREGLRLTCLMCLVRAYLYQFSGSRDFKRMMIIEKDLKETMGSVNDAAVEALRIPSGDVWELPPAVRLLSGISERAQSAQEEYVKAIGKASPNLMVSLAGFDSDLQKIDKPSLWFRKDSVYLCILDNSKDLRPPHEEPMYPAWNIVDWDPATDPTGVQTCVDATGDCGGRTVGGLRTASCVPNPRAYKVLLQ